MHKFCSGKEIDPKLEAVHAAQAFMFTKSGGTRKALVDWGPRTADSSPRAGAVEEAVLLSSELLLVTS